jgi:oligoendopeptidase F
MPNRRRFRSFLRLAIALSIAVSGSLAVAQTSAPEQTPAAPAPAGAPDASGSWNLGELYADDRAWSESLDRTRKRADELAHYRDNFGQSAGAMLAALIAISDTKREANRLLAYASLKSDEDLRIGSNLERKQQARSLRTQIARQTAWLAPETLRIGAKRIQAYRAQNRTLDQRFGFLLADTLRQAPHTLGTEAEDVLAAAGTTLAQPSSLHSILADAEFQAPMITLSDGTSARLDEPGYEKYRQSLNRADRKAVFDAYWAAWKKIEGLSGSLLATSVIGNHFTSQSRKFSDDLQAKLFAYDMPEAVYDTVVAQTNAALPTLHRYLRLRKRLLGITDELRYYDMYPPMYAPTHLPQFSVEDSKRLALAALAPLGDEYLGLLRQGFASRWMNVYPHEGKASGGYMNGLAYDVHPYLLLNHNGDYDSVSTFTHEWGHAVHTLLANRAQPFDKAGYSLFIAESASIGNEMLLGDYMVEHARDRKEKLYYLAKSIDFIRGAYFRQIMFAEFERSLHNEIEQGRALSGGRMSDMYCTLLRKYFGEAEGVMKIDPAYCIEWAFIPHFYNDFYVYQYATSIAGAASMTDAILREGTPARDRFLAMLRAGGSDYPYELYKRAGIDMATAAPYQALAARMNRLLDEFEALEAQAD